MMQSRQPSCVSSLVDDGCLSPVVEVTVSGVAGGVEWSRVDRAGQTKAECLLSDASGTIRFVAWGSYASRLKNRLSNGQIYRISGCSVSSDFTPPTLFDQGRQRRLLLEWNAKTKVVGPVGPQSKAKSSWYQFESPIKSEQSKFDKLFSKLFSNKNHYNELKSTDLSDRKDTNDDESLKISFKCSDDVTAEELLNEGNLLYHTGLYQEALAKYIAARDLCPRVSRYHSFAASCNLAMGQPTEALSFAVHATALDPGSAFAWSMEAEACLLLGKVERASEACEEAKKINNGAGIIRNVDSKVKRMKTLGNDFKMARGMEDFTEALKVLDEALAIATHSLPLKGARVYCLLERGKQSYGSKRFEEAAADFEEVLSKDKDNVECKRFLMAVKAALERKRLRKECLSTMGLDEHATVSEIRKAFRDLSKVHHPDKLVGKSSEDIKEGEAKFKRMKRAFDFIMQSQSS